MIIDTNKFPFEQIREIQETLIDEINLHKDSRFFILNGATGVGKSALGVAAIRTLGKGYYITMTKQLQDQLQNDFGSLSLTNIKGKANYQCKRNAFANCECGPCLVKKSVAADCIKNKRCTYHNLKQQALESDIFLTSYKFLFRAIDCANWTDDRDVIVFDEAHLLEGELVDFAAFTLDTEILNGKYGLLEECVGNEVFICQNMPKDNVGDIKKWIYTIWKPIQKRYQLLKRQLEIAVESENETDIKAAHSALYEFDKLHKKMENYWNSVNEDWLYEVKDLKVIVTPLDVSWIFREFIENKSKKFIFMSATIFDPKCFCDTIGIDPNETSYIRSGSIFDSKKSPVYQICSCKTDYQSLQNPHNLSLIADSIRDILKQHSNEKGLIHTGNFGVSKYLKQNLKDPRLLIRYEKDTNDKILQQHKLLKAPTVLVSSSMTEGVDLIDDLGRFQIIVKLPWPSLADKRVKKLSEKKPNWYQIQCLEKLVQACGRSTRSENDHCRTYLLDAKAKYWIGLWKKNNWVPDYFIDRLINV